MHRNMPINIFVGVTTEDRFQRSKSFHNEDGMHRNMPIDIFVWVTTEGRFPRSESFHNLETHSKLGRFITDPYPKTFGLPNSWKFSPVEAFHALRRFVAWACWEGALQKHQYHDGNEPPVKT